ncbi:hypothetical protein WA026_008735 [Henosepilachna vigintioctopunctata]|uniref:Erythrocyte membrane protein band 4.1-like 4A n=1 Tax=Henosepilachna vigintioctopunctata TaxID=420089 RepID=A0AAW1VA68_9CUCU
MECFCTRTRTICCKVLLLDGQEFFQEVQDSSTGQAILDVVFNHINLIETPYFGLRYLDEFGQTHWLDPTKKLKKQLKSIDPYTLYFGVKFYAVDPCKLLEEITRYQFFLQVKQDILQGRLPVSTELAAELGAYVLQSELGDYDPRVHLPGYVSEFKFVSNQSLELETRITELHKSLVGQLPSTAEYNYLDRVKWLEMYGVDLHPVLGEDSVEYFLGLTPSGIIVLRNKITVGNYYWPRITKIYFKGRYFMLKVTDKNNDESTYGFETPSKLGCKHLWKCCVEHHSFFRLVQVYHPTVPDIFALGSRFRYGGRTEKQALKDAQVRGRVPPTFSRNPSRRFNERNLEEYGVLELDDVLRLPEYGSVKHISIPQPAQGFDYPSHAKDTQNRKSDSPRSTRSAPWTQPHSKGLYNISAPASPRSIRSAGPRYRSSSIDSQSSGDSRTCKRKKHSGRGTSDNESELSKSSSRSHHRHKKHRSRSRKGSRVDSDGSSSRRNSRSRRRESSQPELVDSNYQWKEAKKRVSVDGNANNIQQAHIISGSKMIDDKDYKKSHSAKYKHRHENRHHSPSESKLFLSDEVKKHLEFDLIDTTGMSERQLKEIPYTVVETNNNFKQSKSKVSQARMLDSVTMMEYAENMAHYRKPKSKNMSQYEASNNLMENYTSRKDISENCLKINHDHSDSGLVTDQEIHNNERLLSRKLEMMNRP